MRVAAVGDIHVGAEPQEAPWLEQGLESLPQAAEVLLLAGDLTRCGTPEEARRVAASLGALAMPVVAVLGNHDHHDGRPGEVSAILEDAGVRVLDGTSITLPTSAGALGVAGVKGFGGGFASASLAPFGEEPIKAFAREAISERTRLEAALVEIDAADVRIVLLHYAPIRDTLRGEHPELYPFLGSYLLAEAADGAGVDLVVHGHAHKGAETGTTPGGTRVRNVALPVIRSPYRLFDLHSSG